MARPVTRVLLMSHQLNIGGTERQLAETAKALDRGRFEPHVGCFHADGIRADELRAAGVPILQLPVTSFLSPTAAAGAVQLARYIRRHKIDLVHTFDTPLNVFGVPVARMAGTPLVLSSQRAHRDLTSGAYRRLLRMTDRIVDGIVVNCEYMRRHLVEDEHVPPNRIHLCYNGIGLAIFHPSPRVRRPEVEGAALVIGAVCALRPEKGLATLLDAVAQVAREGLKLVIVGDGPQKSVLQDRARRLGVDCLFVPTTNQVAEWLRSIDIFVLPSLSEAFSNSLMEAMACGCCCIASRTGGNPELTGDEERGLLFDPGNAAELAAALDTLIASRETRAKLSASAARFISVGFSLETAARRMGEIYDTLIYSKNRKVH